MIMEDILAEQVVLKYNVCVVINIGTFSIYAFQVINNRVDIRRAKDASEGRGLSYKFDAVCPASMFGFRY